MTDPVDEYAVRQLKEVDGTKLKPTMKEGLDLGEELKIESEPLKKLMKEALGDKVEEVIVSSRMVDSFRVLTMSEQSLLADVERTMKVVAETAEIRQSLSDVFHAGMQRSTQQRDSSQQQQQQDNQPQAARQSTRPERERKGRKEEGKKRRGRKRTK